MRKGIVVIFSFLMLACSELIDKPKNLVPKDTMAELLAEFAMNEQLTVVVENVNLDNATRYALQQKKIKGNDFVESYKYYTATGEIEKIVDNAQDIVLNKDPAAKIYIEKKLKENKNLPAFAR
ncbi:MULTISPECIES: DUF4296 domain-containing protein [Chryseobacterium]|uniref:DUF4296 domain-containing protein n=1 Tax=Chryseobacterium salivictor TaxID=2547600 RepID=A0A4P6ZE10_9FLAO|nr:MULTISPECIES: DUF4296 domain-containing protein [Chryseobacterium]MDQ0476034.1 sulfur carrier protein ThiS [Chryseobacterium sp. MDT2-18]QBO57632.1 hypothetical protein NBC122_00797 [Chryseobacterium salivictor]